MLRILIILQLLISCHPGAIISDDEPSNFKSSGFVYPSSEQWVTSAQIKAAQHKCRKSGLDKIIIIDSERKILCKK